MSASSQDKITDTRNAARPNSAKASGTRNAGGTSLACDSLTGWPTASKVHFVTYKIDSNSNPVAGTQLDCTGIVSGNSLTSIVVVDGTDAGNAVNDIVEMLPTAAWGQDLADALNTEHNRTGTHSTITANSLTATGNVTTSGNIVTDTVAEKTGAHGVTIDGLNIKDSAITTAASVPPSARSGGFAIGTTGTLSSTGNISITGVGFTPKLVRFTILPSASGTVGKTGTGAMTTTAQYASASSGVNTPSASRNSSTSKCLMAIANASSTVEQDAQYVSMDSDGFTINVTTNTTAYNWAYEAYA